MDKLICVGKNYLEHAKELGDAVPERPVLFLKPPSAALQASQPGEVLKSRLPRERGSIHHETELLIRLRNGGSNLSLQEAEQAIEAVSIGLDMTLRDLQSQLKKAGHPWEVSKVFAGSAILGPWIPVSGFKDYLQVPFTLTLNGSLRQQGCGSQMSLSPAECIAYASECFTLCPGDILFTGTPVGVGPIQPGDLGEIRWGDRLNYRVQWE